jgi:hypothetical protein
MLGRPHHGRREKKRPRERYSDALFLFLFKKNPYALGIWIADTLHLR